MGNMNIKQSIDECLENIGSTHAKKTQVTYATAYNKFIEFCGKIGLAGESDIADVNVDWFIGFSDWLSRQEYAKSTRIIYQAGVRAWIDWLVIHGHFQPDYRDTLRLKMSFKNALKKREKKLPRVVDPALIEAVRLVAREGGKESPLGERNLALIEFLYSTG